MYLPLEAYQPAASALGGAAGGGLGAMLGHALGGVSDVLSAPRRIIWHGIESALGDPNGPDSGSGVLSKYLGMDPDSWLTKGLGMGLEFAGDPLSYAGGVPGLFKGAELGGMAGKALEAAAVAKGPMYAGGAEKLLEAPGIAQALAPHMTSAGVEPVRAVAGNAGTLSAILEGLQESPGFGRALGEMPPGSNYLGHGVEGVAFRTPAGDVLRMSPTAGDAAAGLARPDIPEMLQANRGGLAGDIRVERTPLVDTSGFKTPESPRFERFMRQARGEQSPFKGQIDDISRSIEGAGYNAQDVHAGNLGSYQGRTVVFDPGAVTAREGGPQLAQLGQVGESPGGMTDMLLRALGSDQAVQARLARQASGSGGVLDAMELGGEAARSPVAAARSPLMAFLGDERGSLDMEELGNFARRFYPEARNPDEVDYMAKILEDAMGAGPSASRAPAKAEPLYDLVVPKGSKTGKAIRVYRGDPYAGMTESMLDRAAEKMGLPASMGAAAKPSPLVPGEGIPGGLAELNRPTGSQSLNWLLKALGVGQARTPPPSLGGMAS